MRILIAHDEAFNFTYRANIDALCELGEVSFFSPLHDRLLSCSTQDEPVGPDLLYLPGGYPELFLREIASNSGMMRQIKDYAERGGRLFAECGGFMYLCHDIDGSPMCGVFPYRATMADAHLHLGYCDVKGMKGHEFHYSDVPENTEQLHRYKNVLAGYIHWYWAETGFETLWNTLIGTT